jgi:hypothetical protein
MHDQATLTDRDVRDNVRFLAEAASLNVHGHARKRFLADRVASIIDRRPMDQVHQQLKPHRAQDHGSLPAPLRL